MSFVNFCQALGIIIQTPPPLGVWRRYPTVDHPRKRNGAVKWMGDHGFAQNHAIDTEVSVWSDASATVADKRNFEEIARKAEQERRDMQLNAVKKTVEILNKCVFAKHDYLKRKGFEEEEGYCYALKGVRYLVIPMRVNGSLVGAQIIDHHGTKKFLYGQRTAGAEFVFDNKGTHILVEGYATALSVRKALKNLKRRYTIHVCFSAGNMKKIASTIGEKGIIVCDNDASATGEKTAKEIGWTYWMSPTVGQDFNDFHIEHGIFKAAFSLGKVLDSFSNITPPLLRKA
jgi:putative DNA primase/helicase